MTRERVLGAVEVELKRLKISEIYTMHFEESALILTEKFGKQDTFKIFFDYEEYHSLREVDNADDFVEWIDDNSICNDMELQKQAEEDCGNVLYDQEG